MSYTLPADKQVKLQLRVDYLIGRGVCSECRSQLKRWDAGSRRLSRRAAENVRLQAWPMASE